MNYLLSNIYFPSHGDDKNNRNCDNIINYINKKQYNKTYAHYIVSKHYISNEADSLWLLKLFRRYGFMDNNSGCYDTASKFYDAGNLPIHIVCRDNRSSILSWMLNDETLSQNINNKQNDKNRNDWEHDYNYTPLMTHVFSIVSKPKLIFVPRDPYMGPFLV